MENKKLYIFDLDGTLYLDGQVFPYSLETISKLRENGKLVCFLTNNSSRSSEEYLLKLKKMGFELALKDIITSTQTAISYIKKNYADSLFYVMGSKSMVSEVLANGIKGTDELDIDCQGVLMGYDTELNYQKIINTTKILLKGYPYIATNPDKVCPVSYGYVPDCGSFADMLEHAVHRQPYFVGKPNPDIIREALARFDVTAEETVIVGDRLYTDIQCGKNAGVTTVLVLSGETKSSDLVNTKIRPDYILNDVSELLAIM